MIIYLPYVVHRSYFPQIRIFIPHTIHVWYTYISHKNPPNVRRQIYHTWMLWDTLYPHHFELQMHLVGRPGPSRNPSSFRSVPSGPFLCRFDADDVMHKERLEQQLQVLRGLSLWQGVFVGKSFKGVPWKKWKRLHSLSKWRASKIG